MKTFSPKISVAALAVAVVALGASCASELTGNHGRFVFSYPSPYNAVDFNKPIAPGAQLDIAARSLGERDQLDIIGAVSTDPNVLRISGVYPSAVVVQGGAVGTARLRITTSDGLQDEVDMRVASPDGVRMSHACTDSNFAVYPANTDIRIPFRLVRDNAETVIGYGFWPIKVTPASALTLDRDARDQSALYFRTGKARHRVAIRSTIDETILGLALVENAEVTEVRHEGLPRLIAGQQSIAGFDPSVEGVPFCQSSLLTRARSLTPEVCTATGGLDDGEEDNRDQLVLLTGRAFGVCEFEVSFPEANNGDGITVTHRVPVGAYPSMSGDIDSHTTPWPPWMAALIALLAPLALLPFAAPLVRRLR